MKIFEMLKLIAKSKFWFSKILLGMALAHSSQILAQTEGVSSTGSVGAAVSPGSIEAPLMSGGLGRSGEATNLRGDASASGLSGNVSQMLGGVGSSRVPALGQTGLVGAGAQSQNVRVDLGGVPSIGTTQFQNFVQSTTGKQLAHFGYNLFDRSRFPSLNEVPVPANYVVGPGDEIDIKIWGAVDIGIRLPVDRQGQITIPKVGPITVTGLKSSDLDLYLKKQISKVYSNFEINANIGKLRSIQIFVVGQARNPGAYTVSSLSSFLGAIFESGGPSVLGTMRNIQLLRDGSRVSNLDLYKFIQYGDMASDTRLMPGDVIMIPPAGPRVALNGAIDNSYIFELAKKEETVDQILNYSSSSLSLVTPHKILVERIDNKQTKGQREVQERELDEKGLKSLVRDGDILTLFKISPQFANAVTLRGNVASPLRYAFKPGMRLSDLIPETDALIEGGYYTRKNILVQYEPVKEITIDQNITTARTNLNEINWEYASIERLNKKELMTELITINLEKAIKEKNPEHNLELKSGDIVTIFSVKDIPVPSSRKNRSIKLSGEVNSPGIYIAKPGEKINDLLKRVGGMTTDAFPYLAIFTRESTRLQQQANLEIAIKKMEQNISSQTSSSMQNITNSETNQNLQSEMLGKKLILDRLKSLKPTGRVSMELNVAETELPNIEIEDGDTLFIPNKPNIITVIGAVVAENGYIYKNNKTVKEYIEQAGIIKEADIESAMIFRGNGTITLNKTYENIFGIGNSSFMSLKLNAGDSIYVPEKIEKRTAYTQFIQGAKDWTQLFYQFGLGAAAVKTLRN